MRPLLSLLCCATLLRAEDELPPACDPADAGGPTALLRQRLKASSMLRTEERLLSLVCNNADDHQPATVHSAGVHSLLIVRRDDGAASSS